MEHFQDLWARALDSLRIQVSKPSFETWLKQTVAIDFQNEILIVSAPNDFARDWLESRYANLVRDTLKAITGKSVGVTFITGSAQEVTEKTSPKMVPLSTPPSDLNPKYTFGSFVIGSGNRFAHAASLAVAEQPAEAYNPLFIYGGVGLGKTHLMHAIGHYFQKNNPSGRVVYLSSEKFTNEFINAIQDNKAEHFRNKYRSMDILLIDDIQFLGGKEQTQEEFFHTFNTLHEDNKQIIISSDRHPREIRTLEDRLRSRFEWGLITDVQPPDLETRIAILRKKATAEELHVSDSVLSFIASIVDTNIRELEGALIRVVAYSALMNQKVSPELAEDALKDIILNAEPRTISIHDIQCEVCDYFGLEIDDLKSKKRTKLVALPRQIAMYLARELTEFSLPRIGEDFGGRDHTTVIHAHEKISKSLDKDRDIELAVNDLIKRITRT